MAASEPSTSNTTTITLDEIVASVRTEMQQAIDDLQNRIYGSQTSFTPAPKPEATAKTINPWFVFAGVLLILIISAETLGD